MDTLVFWKPCIIIHATRPASQTSWRQRFDLMKGDGERSALPTTPWPLSCDEAIHTARYDQDIPRARCGFTGAANLCCICTICVTQKRDCHLRFRFMPTSAVPSTCEGKEKPFRWAWRACFRSLCSGASWS